MSPSHTVHKHGAATATDQCLTHNHTQPHTQQLSQDTPGSVDTAGVLNAPGSFPQDPVHVSGRVSAAMGALGGGGACLKTVPTNHNCR